MTVLAENRHQPDRERARRRWPLGRLLVWAACLALVALLAAGLGAHAIGKSARSAAMPHPAARVDPLEADVPVNPQPDGSRWVYLVSYPMDGFTQGAPLDVDRALTESDRFVSVDTTDGAVRAEQPPDPPDDSIVVSGVRIGGLHADTD